jgi:4-diphosphocytidyl-2-C-methyl-D-erythritol kinase
VKLTAPAKVNLSLRILAREESGYHQIETLFCALELHDDIELTPGSAGLRLVVHGPDLGAPDQNLVVRAAGMFYDAIGGEPALEIRLRKNIPAGAGLGGGSSDAAATLLGLNTLHGSPLRSTDLLRLATSLGSDVPFFVAGASVGLAWGRGERILALPSLPRVPVLLAMPDFPVSTQEAYAALAARRGSARCKPAPMIHRLDALSAWQEVAAFANNDFEQVIFEMHPQLGAVRDTLRARGASIALLTGSGSCVYGVFGDSTERDQATIAVQDRFPSVRGIPTWTA